MSQDKTTRDVALSELASAASKFATDVRKARWLFGDAINASRASGLSWAAITARLNEMPVNWLNAIGSKMTEAYVRRLSKLALATRESGYVNPENSKHALSRDQLDLLDMDTTMLERALLGDVLKFSEVSKAIHSIQTGRATPDKARDKLEAKLDPPEPAEPSERETAQAAYDRALDKRNKAQAALDKANAELLAAKRRLDQVIASTSQATIEVPATIAETPKAAKPKNSKPKPTAPAQRAALAS